MNNKNLILGRDVIVRNALKESTNCITQKLTDGALVAVSEPSSWFDVYSGINEISVDFGAPFSVSGFSVAFLHDVSNLCISPETVKLLLSENGNEYYEVLKVNAPYPVSFKYEAKAVYSAELSEPCLARFAKIRFCGEIAAKCGEFRVFGSLPDGNELHLSGAVFKDVDKKRFAKPESIGTKNVALLTFADMKENGELCRLTRADFKPLISYVDPLGNVTDKMFDAIAVCQSLYGNCPSGGCMTYHSEEPSRLSDWEFLIDELFESDYNLKALDEEYSSFKKQMGLDRDNQLKVYLTVPMPKISFVTFGDLNGDGIEEKLLTTEDCISAFNWYVDAVTRRFKAECLPNLRIEGFVWNSNKITREFRDDETYFAKECVAGLHNRGYKCLFIGTQFMSGVEKAQKIGFDCVTLAPSVCNGEISKSTVSACKKYGLGINIPAPLSIDSKKEVAAFVKDISDCIMFDMVNTVHTIDRANLFSHCAFSENETERLIYDSLYEFIKRESEDVSEELYESIAETTVETTAETKTETKSETETFVAASDEAVEDITKSLVDETVEMTGVIEEPEATEVTKEPEESVEEKASEPITEQKICAGYQVPTLKLEISVPKTEPDCPDRKCGYCSKYFPQNVVAPIVQEEKEAEQPVENIIEEKIEQPINEPIEVEADVDEIEEILFEQPFEQPKSKTEKALPKFVKKPDKKTALVAAGVAVAIGTAYLIAKSLKGNENE